MEFPLVAELLERIEAAELATLLFDCTVDTAVPTYMAMVIDRRWRNVGVYRGYGSHLDPAVAMSRAVTEAVQSRAIYIAGSRDDLFRDGHARLMRLDDNAAIRALQRIPATIDARERRSESTATFEGDVHLLLRKLSIAGIEQVVVVDLTRDEIEIPVVRVIGPGLEGYMFEDYAPGRRARAFCARLDAARRSGSGVPAIVRGLRAHNTEEFLTPDDDLARHAVSVPR